MSLCTTNTDTSCSKLEDHQPALGLENNSINDDEVRFLAAWPEYGHPGEIASLRQTEFCRLDDNDEVYVDYTGGGLHTSSQIKEHMSFLQNNVFGNPHSKNPTSLAMTEHVERTRKYVLEFFHASSDEYVCIFTPNASGALRLIGESYPFGKKSQYTLTYDNHNSVNGIREFARAKGAETAYVNIQGQDLHVDMDDLVKKLSQAQQQHGANNLFAFPAQSNFTGTQHSLDLIQLARQHNHHVLVDFAAYAPTNRIDISQCKPDFAVFSFYKIFGYPTGLGCLLVRKDTLKCLERPWFAGGTVELASVSGNWHCLEPNEAAFEDGTIDYLNIPAIEIGLRTVQKLGMDKIKGRVKALTGYFIDNLLKFRHSNGQPLVQLFGAPSTANRGGTITFLLKDPNGIVLDEDRVEVLANEAHISLRTGCFCNPGAAEKAFNLDLRHTRGFGVTTMLKDVSKADYKAFLFQEFGVPVAAIRVSFGVASNFRDASCVLGFIESFVDQSSAQVGGVILDVGSLLANKPKNKVQKEFRDSETKMQKSRKSRIPGMLKKLLSKLSRPNTTSKGDTAPIKETAPLSKTKIKTTRAALGKPTAQSPMRSIDDSHDDHGVEETARSSGDDYSMEFHGGIIAHHPYEVEV